MLARKLGIRCGFQSLPPIAGSRSDRARVVGAAAEQHVLARGCGEGEDITPAPEDRPVLLPHDGQSLIPTGIEVRDAECKREEQSCD